MFCQLVLSTCFVKILQTWKSNNNIAMYRTAIACARSQKAVILSVHFENEFTKILSNSKIVYACLKKSAKNYDLTQVIQRSTTMSQRKSQSSWDCVSNNGLKFFLLKNQMYNNDNASSKIIWTHYAKWREASNGQLSWKKLEFKMHDDHSLDLEYHHFQI